MAARISPTNPRPEINTRQELFCRLIAEGRSQYESYTEAGYKATTRGVADAEACKLLKAPKIVARVKEIQAENALAARISVASVTKMYLAIYDKAMANDDLGPATAAVTGVAKLHGLVIDRAQIEAVIRKPSFDPNAEETMSEADGSSSSDRRSPSTIRRSRRSRRSIRSMPARVAALATTTVATARSSTCMPTTTDRVFAPVG